MAHRAKLPRVNSFAICIFYFYTKINKNIQVYIVTKFTESTKMINIQTKSLNYDVIYLVICILLVLFWYSHTYIKRKHLKYITENPQTLKFKVKPRLINGVVVNDKITDMLFEEDDLKYYKTITMRPSETFVFSQASPTAAKEEDATINTDIINGGEFGTINTAPYDIIDNIDNYDLVIEADIRQNDIHNTLVTLHDSDAQNVHDTDVGKAVRKIFDSVEIEKQCEFDTGDLIDNIKDYVDESNMKRQDIEKIYDVLDTVVKRNGRVSNINGASEIELLAAVWHTANTKCNSTKKNIKDMLLVQLADTFDDGNVLCPSGFANRIATALVVESPKDFPKTSAMINEEMLESAAFIRRRLEADRLYLTLSDADQHAKFKEQLIEKLSKDYEDLMSLNEIKKRISPWIDYI